MRFEMIVPPLAQTAATGYLVGGAKTISGKRWQVDFYASGEIRVLRDGAVSTIRTADLPARVLALITTVRNQAAVPMQRRAFYASIPDTWIATSAFGDWAPFVPAGKVGVCTRTADALHRIELGSAESFPEKWFLVEAREYTAAGQHGHGFEIDPTRHREIAEPSPAERFGPPAAADSHLPASG